MISKFGFIVFLFACTTIEGFNAASVCKDYCPRCPAHKKWCEISSKVKRICPMTCGVCVTDAKKNAGNQEGAKVEEECIDTTSFCPFYKKLCVHERLKPYLEKRCPKTCEVCGRGSGNATIKKTDTGNKTGNDKDTSTSTGTGAKTSNVTVTGGESKPQNAEEEECLKQHNEKRRKHINTTDLVWDEKVAASAQKYADYLLKTGKFEHTPKSQRIYGENLYKSYGSYYLKKPCYYAVRGWYDREINFYNYDKPGYISKAGHFTALIWKSTKKVGVGIAKNARQMVVVAQYYPPGNYIGRFEDNVMRLKSGSA